MKMALYRRYRPHHFGELLGQEAIQQTLQSALEKGHLAHALLFCGPRGTGKTSTARIIARAIQCFDPKDGDACGVCSSCQAHEHGQNLDLIEIDAASNRGIDEIRALRETLAFPPSYSQKKVYIIDEVHMLTKEAFNALLKSLEEPPAHVLFILATTEKQKIPETILSRCQRYDFKLIRKEVMRNHVQAICDKEEISIEPEALEAIIEHAQGGMRDALSILSRFQGQVIRYETIKAALGLEHYQSCERLFHLMQGPSLEASMAWAQTIQENGLDIPAFIAAFLSYLRESLHQVIQHKSPMIPAIIELADIFEDAWRKANQSPLPALSLEVAIVKAHEAFHKEAPTPSVVQAVAPKTAPSAAPKVEATPTPAPSAAPAPAPTFAPAPTPVATPHAMQQEWNALRAKIAQNIAKTGTKLSLNSAELDTWTDAKLTLRFDSHFHKEQCDEAGVAGLLKNALTEKGSQATVLLYVKEKDLPVSEALGWPTTEEFIPPNA